MKIGIQRILDHQGFALGSLTFALMSFVFISVFEIKQSIVVKKDLDTRFELTKANPVLSQPHSVSDIHQKSKNIDWNLFGHYVSDEMSIEHIASTRQPFTLNAVLNAEQSNTSQVIISTDAEGSKRYALNDKLPGGAKIIQIYERAVIIQNGEKLEKLSMTENPLIFATFDSQLNELG